MAVPSTSSKDSYRIIGRSICELSRHLREAVSPKHRWKLDRPGLQSARRTCKARGRVALSKLMD